MPSARDTPRRHVSEDACAHIPRLRAPSPARSRSRKGLAVSVSFLSSLHAVFMVLLFGSLYKLRAEKAAAGERVVVVGPPCAGKTTFIKQFLEPRGVESAEEAAGLAPGAEETREEGLLQRLRKRVWGRYVRGDEVKRQLDGISGAGHLETFDKLPRDFVEYLKKRYGGWSLYLFYIPPDAEYEEAARSHGGGGGKV